MGGGGLAPAELRGDIMAKKSRKQRKQGKSGAAPVHPLSLLRPHLDELLGDEALAERDDQAIVAELDRAFGGLKFYDALPALLRSYEQAPPSVQRRLDALAPEWLTSRGELETLRTLLQHQRIHEGGRRTALGWLERAGAEAAELEALGTQPSFYRAYIGGNEFQGVVTLFFYSDARRRQVKGLHFLLDHNPPWEGAVKELAVFPQEPPESAVREFEELWEMQGTPMQQISAEEVKKEILTALEANRREKIRLPRDLVFARQLFVDHVLTLPDTPETPAFGAEDFDALSKAEHSPEQLRAFEQTVGYRTRLPDGEEVLIVRDADDLDEELEEFLQDENDRAH